ncbi:hypothetical protein NH340_JMT00202 [Sarcoptes scabiei]|nr:hypothetical protein NH340_JMT00202 [Sarcoptes scabiei]
MEELVRELAPMREIKYWHDFIENLLRQRGKSSSNQYDPFGPINSQRAQSVDVLGDRDRSPPSTSSSSMLFSFNPPVRINIKKAPSKHFLSTTRTSSSSLPSIKIRPETLTRNTLSKSTIYFPPHQSPRTTAATKVASSPVSLFVGQTKRFETIRCWLPSKPLQPSQSSSPPSHPPTPVILFSPRPSELIDRVNDSQATVTSSKSTTSSLRTNFFQTESLDRNRHHHHHHPHRDHHRDPHPHERNSYFGLYRTNPFQSLDDCSTFKPYTFNNHQVEPINRLDLRLSRIPPTFTKSETKTATIPTTSEAMGDDESDTLTDSATIENLNRTSTETDEEHRDGLDNLVDRDNIEDDVGGGGGGDVGDDDDDDVQNNIDVEDKSLKQTATTKLNELLEQNSDQLQSSMISDQSRIVESSKKHSQAEPELSRTKQSQSIRLNSCLQRSFSVPVQQSDSIGIAISASDMNLKRSPSRPIFTSSSFYDPMKHPTMEEQVMLCRKIAKQLVSDDANSKSKGRSMFKRRVEKSSQWITENEDSFQNYSNADEDFHERTISDGLDQFFNNLVRFDANIRYVLFVFFSFTNPKPRPSKSSSSS